MIVNVSTIILANRLNNFLLRISRNFEPLTIVDPELEHIT